LQGASAIESLLEEFPVKSLKVFVIWEPVLTTDWSAPATAVLSRVFDRRVSQMWDPDLVISSAIGAGLRADPAPVIGKESLVEGKIVWDFVGVYAPGVKWNGDAPVPDFKGAPIVHAIAELRNRLTRSK
jgi:hypothetical protein